jgi:hypothetical protein
MGGALVWLVAVWGPNDEGSLGGGHEVDLKPVVSATVPVGKPGLGINAGAVGEGGIWVAGFASVKDGEQVVVPVDSR